MKSIVATIVLCSSVLGCIVSSPANAQDIDDLLSGDQLASEDALTISGIEETPSAIQPEFVPTSYAAEQNSPHLSAHCESCTLDRSCGHCLSSRNGLMNDFFGLRPALAQHGIIYKAWITPWFHLTADLQLVEPAIQANDTAVVFGVRAKIDL